MSDAERSGDFKNPVVCAWCTKTMREGSPGLPTSHGICAACVVTWDEVEDIHAISAERADTLPWGAIRLRGDGTVVQYNAAESAYSRRAPGDVIGKHFFREVAPCTAVREFEGALDEMRASGVNGVAELDFSFRFPGRAMKVSIRMVYSALRDSTVILVRPLDGAAPR